MQIDRTQRGWAIGSLGIFAAALALYLFETWGTERGARGGSAIGLFFGVVGFGFMIFAAARGARRRGPTLRVGRAEAWVEGALCGGEGRRGAGGLTALRAIGGGGGRRRASGAVSAGGSAGVVPGGEILLLGESESEPLRSFYVLEIQPFLERPKERGLRLSDATRAASAFTALRTLLPAAVHGTLSDLEDICDEARQLLRQERLHQWLPGWLLLHIPLSLALILLGAVHAVMALRW